MTTDATESVEETTSENVEETTEEHSADYLEGYEAGKSDLKTEIQSQNREVGVLLALESYDFLSDKEVRALIEYELNLYKISDEASAIKQRVQTGTEEIKVANANFCIDARNVLQSIIDSKTNYEGVEPESVTSYLETVQEV